MLFMEYCYTDLDEVLKQALLFYNNEKTAVFLEKRDNGGCTANPYIWFQTFFCNYLQDLFFKHKTIHIS